MSTPSEEAEAVRHAGEFLALIYKRKDIPDSVRIRAQEIMRHFPVDARIKAIFDAEWKYRDLCR